MRLPLFFFLGALGALVAASGRAETPEAAPADTFSIHIPDEDVRQALRDIADIGEINLVMPDTLQGRTSVKLRDVTWQYAFDVILKPLGWKHEVDGNIVKVVPRGATTPTEDPVSDDMIARLTELQVTALKSMLRDEDYADALADFHWNLYRSLLKKGFTKEEALRIVVASGPPTQE
jgi:type II secretory pathway component HofQ